MKIAIGLAIGVQLGGNNPSATQTALLLNAFKLRVAADTGLFSAETCLSAILEKLNSI